MILREKRKIIFITKIYGLILPGVSEAVVVGKTSPAGTAIRKFSFIR